MFRSQLPVEFGRSAARTNAMLKRLFIYTHELYLIYNK
jgi:hypothetical protein